MNNLIARPCNLAIAIVISMAATSYAGQKQTAAEYWPSQVNADCSNVPPLQTPTGYAGSPEPEEVRSQDDAVNSYFSELIDEFKKKHFENASAASKRILQSESPNERQKECAKRILIESKNAIANEENKLAEERRRAKQQAALPDGQLKTVYMSYMLMQACYEARKEFRVPYVSKQELDTARAITVRKEQELLKKFPKLAPQKDALWEQSKQKYMQSTVMDLFEAAEVNEFVTLAVANDGGIGLNVAQMFGNAGTKHSNRVDQVCKGFSTVYTTDEQQQQNRIKKDF